MIVINLCRVRDRLGAYWEEIAPKIRALPLPVGKNLFPLSNFVAMFILQLAC